MGDTTMTDNAELEVQVRVTWNTCDCEYTTKHCDEYHQRGTLMPLPMLENPVAWFAAHDAEVAANALREAADETAEYDGHGAHYAAELRTKADRIEREAANHNPMRANDCGNDCCKPNPELGDSR